MQTGNYLRNNSCISQCRDVRVNFLKTRPLRQDFISGWAIFLRLKKFLPYFY